MKSNNTFTASIYVGLCQGYNGPTFSKDILEKVCQDFCNDVGFCVTFTETRFIYKNGSEPGVIVGIINYPRFPSTIEVLKNKAIDLASLLMVAAKQNRVSIVFSDETVMLENGNV